MAILTSKKMKRRTVFLLLMVANLSMAHNGEGLDSLISAKAKENGVKSMTIKLKYTGTDHFHTHETKQFDKHGQVIEHLIPTSAGTDRRKVAYDSLGHRIHFFRYLEEDTTVLSSERYWFYTNSSLDREEFYGNNHVHLTTKTFEQRKNGDTVWITEVETDHKYAEVKKSIARHINLGDSVLTTEFIKLNDEGKLGAIDCYYDRYQKDNLGNTVFTEGEYLVQEEAFADLVKSPEFMRDYYQNPSKYLQKQLDGEYPFEFGSPFTYEIRSPGGKLLQAGYTRSNKSVYQYNSQNQLVKISSWGRMGIDGDNGINRETIYTYYPNGLPKALEERDLIEDRVNLYNFEYTYSR